MTEEQPVYSPEPPSAPNPPPRSGGANTCLTLLGIGCLTLFLLAVAAGLVLYFKGKDIARAGMAKVTEAAAEAMFEGMQFPSAERDAAMVPVREFAKRIRAGEVSWEQGAKVMEAVVEGPVSVVVMARAFEVQYLQRSALSPEEKKEGHVDISRFSYGVAEGKIPREKAQPILDIVIEKPAESRRRGQGKLRESITTEELKKCLKVAKDEADAAGIEPREHSIDLAGEIRKAIDKGMKGEETGIENK